MISLINKISSISINMIIDIANIIMSFYILFFCLPYAGWDNIWMILYTGIYVLLFITDIHMIYKSYNFKKYINLWFMMTPEFVFLLVNIYLMQRIMS